MHFSALLLLQNLVFLLQSTTKLPSLKWKISGEIKWSGLEGIKYLITGFHHNKIEKFGEKSHQRSLVSAENMQWLRAEVPFVAFLAIVMKFLLSVGGSVPSYTKAKLLHLYRRNPLFLDYDSPTVCHCCSFTMSSLWETAYEIVGFKK